MKFPKKSNAAWFVMGAFVLAYDIIALTINEANRNDTTKHVETISDGAWRTLEHPDKRRKYGVWFGILVLAKHLGAPHVLRELDPIGIVGLIVRAFGSTIRKIKVV